MEQAEPVQPALDEVVWWENLLQPALPEVKPRSLLVPEYRRHLETSAGTWVMSSAGSYVYLCFSSTKHQAREFRRAHAEATGFCRRHIPRGS